MSDTEHAGVSTLRSLQTACLFLGKMGSRRARAAGPEPSGLHRRAAGSRSGGTTNRQRRRGVRAGGIPLNSTQELKFQTRSFHRQQGRQARRRRARRPDPRTALQRRQEARGRRPLEGEQVPAAAGGGRSRKLTARVGRRRRSPSSSNGDGYCRCICCALRFTSPWSR